MGLIFNIMHLRLAKALQDTKTDGVEITLASHDGKRRTSAERNEDLTRGRYFVHSLLRIIDREMYHGKRSTVSFDSSGFLDISAYDIINHREITLLETSVRYGNVVPTVKGSGLAFYKKLLETGKRGDLVAAVVADHSLTPRKTRLQLLKGSDLSYALDTFVFDVFYYSVAKLYDLVGISGVKSGTISSAGTVVTGASTIFLTELMIGSTITAAAQTKTVTAVNSNTELIVDTAFSSPLGGGTAYTINSHPDVVELKAWHSVIDQYALYLARLSSDSEKAQLALNEANRLALFTAGAEYGREASVRLAQALSIGVANG
jgi:hypothetical protein